MIWKCVKVYLEGIKVKTKPGQTFSSINVRVSVQYIYNEWMNERYIKYLVPLKI